MIFKLIVTVKTIAGLINLQLIWTVELSAGVGLLYSGRVAVKVWLIPIDDFVVVTRSALFEIKLITKGVMSYFTDLFEIRVEEVAVLKIQDQLFIKNTRFSTGLLTLSIR